MLNQRALLLAGCLLIGGHACAATASPLFARGYSVVPEPQRVVLEPGEFRFDSRWHLESGPGVSADSAALAALRDELARRCGIALAGSGGGVLRLAIRPGSVEVGAAADRDRAVLAEQAYRISLAPDAVVITANAGQGLFYGVQTLVQMLKLAGGQYVLPEGTVTDWPDLQLRQIYWDDAHHLDRMEELKRAVRQAAFYKINGFAIKLEGHFQYKSAPALVEPYALSPAELQELTDYGLRHYVQVIPYLDAPAHIAFILKHPEYAALRSFPQSNYEACVANPATYKLLTGMFQDLMDANRGVRYIYLSTDEAYYVGLADNPQCREKDAAAEKGGVGKLLAAFISSMADYLHDRGRTVIFWGEYPLKRDDIAALPRHIVNGEVYGPEFDAAYKAHGIRQTIFTSAQSGEAKLFPDYFILPPARRLHDTPARAERVAEGFRKISFDSARRDSDLMGAVVAGWADMGLHAETFWLGYATIAAAAWHPGSPDPAESTASFLRLFYGPSAVNMERVYRLMSFQAQTWRDTWETVPSKSRKPIFGSSYTIYEQPRPARDQALPLPPAPSPENLGFDPAWLKENARRLDLAAAAMPENDELFALLRENLARAEFNRYNLEVYLAVAQLYRHNLLLIEDLGRMCGLLDAAQAAARASEAKRAVGALDEALRLAAEMRARRNTTMQDLAGTYYKSWYPRVPEANGRRVLHELDDVKDHLADRTIGLDYMVQRELTLPVGEWVNAIRAARNRYAAAHAMPAAEGAFDWAAGMP